MRGPPGRRAKASKSRRNEAPYLRREAVSKIGIWEQTSELYDIHVFEGSENNLGMLLSRDIGDQLVDVAVILYGRWSGIVAEPLCTLK